MDAHEQGRRGAAADDLQPKGPCEHCGSRPASIWWTGEGGFLSWVHGGGRPWCMVCTLSERVKHLEGQVAKLPAMRAKLAALLDGSKTDKQLLEEELEEDKRRILGEDAG
jgi:hypothetical protein